MLLDRYLPRIEFDSYEDFKENYRVNVPEDFNFGWDIVDEWAKQEPEKKALIWLSHDKQERTFTFTDISKLSSRNTISRRPSLILLWFTISKIPRSSMIYTRM